MNFTLRRKIIIGDLKSLEKWIVAFTVITKMRLFCCKKGIFNYFFGLILILFVQLFAEPWKFGIISDTQWWSLKGFDTGNNPNSVAVGIINQVNKEFISHGVKFVIAPGDLTDKGSKEAIDTRVTFVQELYNNGIGFYPIRGNHEESAEAAKEFIRVFPQTVDGINNRTPKDAFVYDDSSKTHPVKPQGSDFTVGSNFSSPDLDSKGLSYAFSYNNAFFVLLDQFTSPSGKKIKVKDHLNWIESVISSRKEKTHAFVISHKGLLMPNHADGLFGANPAEDPVSTNKLISMMYKNNVRYLINGHDHIHNRSLVYSQDGSNNRIEEITLQSDSYKFYDPNSQSNDDKYNFPAFGRRCEIPIAQQSDYIGYYIVTVDSLDTKVDYYGVEANPVLGSIPKTPSLTGNWKKQESFGYCLNGKEFLIPKDSTYKVVRDTFEETYLAILDGVNRNSSKDGSGRYFTQVVSCGWKNRLPGDNKNLSSNIATLRGMHHKMGSAVTESYTLSISYSSPGSISDIINGNFGIIARSENGSWTNAVDLNSGGQKKFVSGKWNGTYQLGTYGIDTTSKTAWAVINYNGDFAVSSLGVTPICEANVKRVKFELVVNKDVILFPDEYSGKEIKCCFYKLNGQLVHKSVVENGRYLLSDLNGVSKGDCLIMKWSFNAVHGLTKITLN